VAALHTPQGRVLLVLTRCWRGPGGLYRPWQVIEMLTGSRVEASGLLVETRAGPALLAFDVRGPGGLELHRAPCMPPGMPPGGEEREEHGSGDQGRGWWHHG